MAYEKLKELDCWQGAEDRLKAGVSPKKVAEWIHGQGEYGEVKLSSLERQLYRYREDLPVTEDAVALAKVPEFLRKKFEELDRNIDVAEELEKLYNLQVSRIAMAMQREEQINFLTKSTKAEFDVARQLLMDLAKIRQDLGEMERTPNQVLVSGVIEHAERQLDSGGRRRLSSVAQKILNSISAEGEDDEDVQEADFELVEQ